MLDIWFPQDCVGCGQPPNLICESCRQRQILRTRAVTRPGLPAGIAVTDYAGFSQQLVHAFKLTGSHRLAQELGRQMAEQFQAAALIRRTDASPAPPIPGVILIPAPSRKAANRNRGYQPATLLAKEVARFLRAAGTQARVQACLELHASVLDQSQLTAAERERNLVGKVRCNPADLQVPKDWKLVLLDDIVTTGATLRGMSAALVSEGYQPETFLTFAETL
jgi:predicted amidophosphoribosyltransferase